MLEPGPVFNGCYVLSWCYVLDITLFLYSMHVSSLRFNSCIFMYASFLCLLIQVFVEDSKWYCVQLKFVVLRSFIYPPLFPVVICLDIAKFSLLFLFFGFSFLAIFSPPVFAFFYNMLKCKTCGSLLAGSDRHDKCVIHRLCSSTPCPLDSGLDPAYWDEV